MTSKYLTKTQLAAWRAFLRAHASVVDRLHYDLVSAGCLPLSSYHMLAELYDAPEQRLTLRALAAQFFLKPNELTRLADKLEAEGFVTQERSDADVLETSVAITDQGIAAQQRAWPIYSRGVDKYCIQLMNEIELEHFDRGVNDMVKISSNYADAGRI